MVRDTLRTLRGVARSLRIYYGDRARRTAMDRLYGAFVRPGDLVFDVGAHVGDRIGAFRRLGARVLEPIARDGVYWNESAAAAPGPDLPVVGGHGAGAN